MTESKRWRDAPLAVVDVETTGLNPEDDRVIEIGIVQMVGGEVVKTYSSLVKPPDGKVPEEVERITGIKSTDLEDAPGFEAIADDVLAHLEGHVFVAYNLAFDRAFVKAELERAGREWIETQYLDPLIFVRELHRNQGSKRLGAVAARLGIPLEEAHRAAHDAEAAGRVLYALGDQLPEHLDELLVLQAQWEQQQAAEMSGWRGRRGGGAIDSSVTGFDAAARGNALGPAYIYGEDTDHVRAMFTHLPDSGSRR